MKKQQITNEKLKKSGIIFSIFLSIVFICLPLIHSKQVAFFPLVIIIYLIILSLFQPGKLKKPYLIWMKFGEYLGKFNTNLLLSIFFFLAITPASLIRNLIKFILKKNKSSNSYYIIKDNSSSFEDEY